MSLDAYQIYLSDNCSPSDIDEPDDEQLAEQRAWAEEQERREEFEYSSEGIAARAKEDAEQLEEMKRESLVLRIISAEMIEWHNLTTEELQRVVEMIDRGTALV